MRHLLIFAALLLLSILKVLGQEKQQVPDLIKVLTSVLEESPLPTQEVVNHIGSDVYVRDTISGYKLVNRALKLLYLGYPKQILTIIIKGKEMVNQTGTWNFGIGHFSGKAIMYHKKPAILITNMYQLGTRIMI